jgi:tetratricopeptide (TPR) repeat protein
VSGRLIATALALLVTGASLAQTTPRPAAPAPQPAQAATPQPLQAELDRGRSLAWEGNLAEAERVVRHAAERAPGSAEAQALLGQILLWQNRAREGRPHLEKALALDPQNLDARRGLAQAAWWSGDWRTARREAQHVLAAVPSDETAREIVAGIRAETRPSVAIDSLLISDDQPYTLFRNEAAFELFSDPLTKWRLAAGSYSADDEERNLRETIPFAELSLDTAIAPRVRIGGRLRALRFADGETGLLPALSATFLVTGPSRLIFSFDENELLRTSSSIVSSPSVRTTAARWEYESSRLSGAAAARFHDYFDDNRGISADAWIVRSWRAGPATLYAGPAIAYRDTDEPRFSLLPGSGEGVYDPYWTPHELREARLALAATFGRGAARFGIHGDYGTAQDELRTSDPAAVVSSRSFNPWRLRAELNVPIGGSLQLTLGAGRESTAFYEAEEVHAWLVGRF